MRRKRICFLVPHPVNESPSQRFRLESYTSLLQSKGFEVSFLPFLNQTSSKFKSKNSVFIKIFIVTRALFLRPFDLRHVVFSDFVVIHREVAPLGPPILEWFISRFLKKKIIYDFDDAIWLTDKTGETCFTKALRWRSKVSSICKWSYKISCGNPYLANYAKQFNPSVVINPTTIDTEKACLRSVQTQSKTGIVTIGWTGSHSTLKYLAGLLPVLRLVEKKYPQTQFLIICDEVPRLGLKNELFRRWNKETEMKELELIDIGVMPLTDDAWTRGKCGFKALQYMAMGVPAVVSPVGVNVEIVRHGIDGFLCNSEAEWFKYLEKLILNAELRQTIGLSGRQRVAERYSVVSNAANFLSLFQ